MGKSTAKKSIIVCYLKAMRLPFITVALVPFAVGIAWAISDGMKFSIAISILGVIAVFCICSACHFLGEVFDQDEDRRTIIYGRSKFAGGTLMIVEGHISPLHAVIAAVFFLGFAFICGLIITFYYRNLILFGLGAFGAAAAVLYSVPPLRLAKRGVGELFIGVCYGWLTLTTGYATACGILPSNSLLICLPVALSVFNIILINEFPDFRADMEAGKKTLVVRIGKDWASKVYGAANFLIIIFFFIICRTLHPDSYIYLLILIPSTVLALVLSIALMLLKKWKYPERLEKFCGLTIILNHICSLTLAALFLCR